MRIRNRVLGLVFAGVFLGLKVSAFAQPEEETVRFEVMLNNEVTKSDPIMVGEEDSLEVRCLLSDKPKEDKGVVVEEKMGDIQAETNGDLPEDPEREAEEEAGNAGVVRVIGSKEEIIWETEISPGEFKKIPVSEIEDGRYELEVVSEEEIVLTRKLILDRLSPGAGLICEVPFGSYVDSPFLIRGEVSDLMSGIREVKLHVNGEPVSFDPESGFWLDPDNYPEGELKICLIAEDECGNQAREEEFFIVDLFAPVITVSEPESASYGEEREFEFSVTDRYLSSYTANVCYTDSQGNRENLSGEWSFLLNREGEYSYEVSATDKAGHSSFVRGSIRVDLTAPVISELTQFSGKYLSEFELSIPESEFIRDFSEFETEYRLDGMNYEPGLKVRSEGLHVLMIIARDVWNHESIGYVRFVIRNEENEEQRSKEELKEETEKQGTLLNNDILENAPMARSHSETERAKARERSETVDDENRNCSALIVIVTLLVMSVCTALFTIIIRHQKISRG